MPKHAAHEAVILPEPYGRRVLNAQYRAIPLKDTTFRLLRKYFTAMSNLYGIISLRKAYEIIQAQNPGLVSSEEFLLFSEAARHECEGYYILGRDELYHEGRLNSPLDREIIDFTLIEADLKSYRVTHRAQQGKPYYIPSKSKLLSYIDPFFCDTTDTALALQNFLTNQLRLPSLLVDDVFDEIVYGVRCLGADLSQVRSHLSDMGVTFARRHDASAFAALFGAFHDDTRMQYHRGHTPAELFAMLPPEDRIIRSLTLGPSLQKALTDGSADPDALLQRISDADLPSEEIRLSLLRSITDTAEKIGGPRKKVKTGRNDPCPCGSGLKYKKCCGR